MRLQRHRSVIIGRKDYISEIAYAYTVGCHLFIAGDTTMKRAAYNDCLRA